MASIYSKLKKEAQRLSIQVNEKSNHSAYYYRGRVIEMDGNHVEIAPSLSHEIGHCIRFDSLTKEEMASVDNAYSSFYAGRYNKQCVELVYREEKIAWQIGRRLLKKLGYKDWKRFDNFRKESLAAYSAWFNSLEDMNETRKRIWHIATEVF